MLPGHYRLELSFISQLHGELEVLAVLNMPRFRPVDLHSNLRADDGPERKSESEEVVAMTKHLQSRYTVHTAMTLLLCEIQRRAGRDCNLQLSGTNKTVPQFGTI